MSTSPPLVVADRYRLVAPLGQGGMGRVWRATDVVLHREVAIKELVPPPGLTVEERQEMRERSLREARAIARLNNINVVRVFDVLKTDADPWIVMEYVASRSLHDILASDGPFPPVRAAEIGLGVLNALRAAHRAGVVHRDVKPGNVLIGEDGRVVLTDFGLATVPGDPNVTRTGLVLGSPAYIAPERARDGTAGPGADLWGLGATLYAAVEGQSPFARPSAMETLTALATENPPPARNAGPLKPVLNGLLRKDPAHRISTEEAERLLLRATGRRSKISFPMSSTMRRPGLGRERSAPLPPPVVPGPSSVSGSAPVVPGPRPPLSAGRPPAAPPATTSGSGAPVYAPGKASVGKAAPAVPLDATRVDAPPVVEPPKPVDTPTRVDTPAPAETSPAVQPATPSPGTGTASAASSAAPSEATQLDTPTVVESPELVTTAPASPADDTAMDADPAPGTAPDATAVAPDAAPQEADTPASDAEDGTAGVDTLAAGVAAVAAGATTKPGAAADESESGAGGATGSTAEPSAASSSTGATVPAATATDSATAVQDESGSGGAADGKTAAAPAVNPAPRGKSAKAAARRAARAAAAAAATAAGNPAAAGENPTPAGPTRAGGSTGSGTGKIKSAGAKGGGGGPARVNGAAASTTSAGAAQAAPATSPTENSAATQVSTGRATGGVTTGATAGNAAAGGTTRKASDTTGTAVRGTAAGAAAGASTRSGGSGRPPWQGMPVKPPPAGRAATPGPSKWTQRRKLVLAGALAAVALAVALLLPTVLADDKKGPPVGRAGTGGAAATATAAASQAPAASAPGPTTAAPSAVASAAPTAAATSAPPPAETAFTVPAGWKMYSDKSGFSVPVPQGWSGPDRDGSEVYFRERGGSGRLLIIDQTRTPAPDPVADWKQLERDRRSGWYRNYEGIRIVPVSYWDKAADWEYQYTSDGGNRIRTLKRGFITAEDQAYGITWRVPSSAWDQHRDDLEVVFKGFKPARS